MIDLKQGDCLELMKDIPDGSIDMILCDLPYGTTANKWDSTIPLEPLWEQYKRIIKDHGCIALFAQPPFSYTLGNSNRKMFRYQWTWKKVEATGFLHAKRMPMKCNENILIFYKHLPIYNPQMRHGFKPYRATGRTHTVNYYGIDKVCIKESKDGSRFPIDIIETSSRERGLHPTQKPVDVLEYLTDCVSQSSR